VTWLFRVQRVGRNRSPLPLNTADKWSVGFARVFPWIVVLLLGVEVALLVWMGLLPR
jgi:hypothetical protein